MQDKENLKERIQKYKEDRKERRKRLRQSFIELITKNRLYVICLVITVLYVGSSFYVKITTEVTNIKVASNVEDQTAEPISKEQLEEQINIEPYIGIYSREITLASTINIENCEMSSYKLIYQINKDKSINKYFQTTCLGTIKMYSETLAYYNEGGARYIGIQKENFIFGTSSMKELDGETYKIDESINNIKETLSNKTYQISFNDDHILLQSKDNLIYIKESLIDINLSNEYKSNGGSLEQRLYKSQNNNDIYKLIVFNNNEKQSCYQSSDSNETNYIIYEIKYDKSNDTYSNINQIQSRTKQDGCSTYEEDLKTIKE